MKEGKVWGQTKPLWSSDTAEIHAINVKEGHKCSKHRHNCRYNGFYVAYGQLIIRRYKREYDLVDETVLNAGESTVAMPGEFHEFEATADTGAIEWYWVECRPDDIERETVGGVADYSQDPAKHMDTIYIVGEERNG